MYLDNHVLLTVLLELLCPLASNDNNVPRQGGCDGKADGCEAVLHHPAAIPAATGGQLRGSGSYHTCCYTGTRLSCRAQASCLFG